MKTIIKTSKNNKNGKAARSPYLRRENRPQMGTNIFDTARTIYRNQASVGSAFRNEDGAIDLASIMVGIIVIGLIGAVIAATVFAVIPWAQDAGAKQQLDSIHQAESAYRGLSSDASKLPAGATPNSFGSSPLLSQANLLSLGTNYCVVTNSTGTGYTAYSASATGTVWMNTDQSTTATQYNGTISTACPSGYTSGGSQGSVSTSTATATPHLFTSLALSQQSGAPANASGIATSSDGSILVVSNDINVGSSSSNYLQRSTDGGKTWTQLTGAGNHSWYGVSSSADGQTILAVANGNYVYLSKDGGNTWTQDPGTVTGSSDGWSVNSKLGSQIWVASATSRNGQTLVVGSGGSGGHVWWSEDGGSTWTEHGSSDFRMVSVSDDGNVIAAASSSLSLWDMTISGTKNASASWSQQGNNVSSKYTGVSVSGDGLTVLAGMADQYGCLVVGTRSTNNMTTGFTYTQLGMGYNSPRTTSPNVPSDTYHVSISADGTKALAVGQNGHVLTSTNLTAHPATTDPTWPNYPTVTDGGFSLATFTAQTPPSSGAWWGSAMSSDGSHLAFGSQNNVPLVTGVWN